MKSVGIAEIWSPAWDRKAESILNHPCACCGRRGHYQRHLESLIRANGFVGGVTLNADGTVDDGHHRIVVARRLGIEHVPVETASDAHARWGRDQDAIKALVPYSPIPLEVWRWALATSEAGYQRADGSSND